jgi:threonine dehydrogenase-like Zn-dependent dehydrogenase
MRSSAPCSLQSCRIQIATVGSGPVGLTGLCVARAVDAPVIGVAINPERLALASRLGADTVVDAADEDTVVAIRHRAGARGANRGAM